MLAYVGWVLSYRLGQERVATDEPDETPGSEGPIHPMSKVIGGGINVTERRLFRIDSDDADICDPAAAPSDPNSTIERSKVVA